MIACWRRCSPPIERKGATNPYTSLNGHMFSHLTPSGVLALRLPAGAREDFLTRYSASLLIGPHGKPMAEFVAVPASLLEDTAALSIWLEQSQAYVAALKPKPTDENQAGRPPPHGGRRRHEERLTKTRANGRTTDIRCRPFGLDRTISMKMSLRDGSRPKGWAIREAAGMLVQGRSDMATYAVHTACPNEAEEIVRRLYNIAADRALDVFSNLSADTLGRLGLAPGEAAAL